MVALVVILVALVVAGLIAAGRSLRIVQQYEQGIIFRFGRVLPGTRGPGLTLIRPVGDRMQKVNMQIVAMAVPAQEGRLVRPVADLGECEHAIGLDVPGIHALGQLNPALDLRCCLVRLAVTCVYLAVHDVHHRRERVLVQPRPARQLERVAGECFGLADVV
jgi:hypothetical protein